MMNGIKSAGWYVAYVAFAWLTIAAPVNAQPCLYWYEGTCSTLHSGWECYEECYCYTNIHCWTPNSGWCGDGEQCCEQQSLLRGKLSSYGDCNELCDFATNRACSVPI